MCRDCAAKRLVELEQLERHAGLDFCGADGKFTVCILAHDDHSHIRYRSAETDECNATVSAWHSLPVPIDVLQGLLQDLRTYEVHLHANQNSAAVETPGLTHDAAKTLSRNQRRLSKFRRTDDKICAICFDTMCTRISSSSITTLPCGHAFHTKCSKEWLKRSDKCPTCRFELTTDAINSAIQKAEG